MMFDTMTSLALSNYFALKCELVEQFRSGGSAADGRERFVVNNVFWSSYKSLGEQVQMKQLEHMAEARSSAHLFPSC